MPYLNTDFYCYNKGSTKHLRSKKGIQSGCRNPKAVNNRMYYLRNKIHKYGLRMGC